MRRSLVIAAAAATVIIAAGAFLQGIFGWRVPVNGSGIPADLTAQSLRSRRTLAELRRAGMQTTRSPLVINEIMTLNPGTVLDERLTASDWVELYNRSDEPIVLEGFALSDSRSASRRWTLPDVLLPPREHLLVWCSGRDEVNTPLSRLLRMVPTSRETWTMEYDDRAPGGIAVMFDEDDEPVDPYVVAINVPESGEYPVSILSACATQPAGELDVSINRGDAVSLPVPAGEEFRWIALRNPATADGTWPFGAGLQTIAIRGGRGKVRVAQLSCRPDLPEGVGVNRDKSHHFLHAGFRLAAEGESVILTDAEGKILDYVTPPPMPPGRTYGRVPDGADAFTVGSPSPGGAMLGPPPDMSAPPTFSESAITVEPPTGCGAKELRYTLDGSAPIADDPLFTDSLAISNHAVLSVRGFTDGVPSTDTAIRQFWVGSLPDAPVLCVATEPAYLDYTDLGVFNRRKKRGRDWERRSHVLLFDGTDVAFDGLAALRSHGWRHPDRTQNSFHINFRPSFGEDRLRYNILNPSSSVRARCIIADASTHGWSDHLSYDLARGLGGAAPHARPVIVFVNGEPYNLGTLVENVDESFLMDRWGHTDFDVIKRKPSRLKRGSWDTCRRLHQYLRDEQNLSTMTAAGIKPLLDVDSLTQWMLTIILGDASEGGKHITREAFQGYFYSDRTLSPPSVGMIAWDVDCSFQCVDYNTLEGIMQKTRFTTPVGAFRALLRNDPEYVQQFVQATEYALDHTFNEEALGPAIDLYDNLYEQYAAHCILGAKVVKGESEEVSGEELQSFREEWRAVFEMARRVLRERPEIVRKHIAALRLGETPRPTSASHPER